MASAELQVEIAYSREAGRVERRQLSLPVGSTVREAIERSGLLPAGAAPDSQGLAVGVWGALRRLDDVLRDKDRVELYRPLKVDPKEARRLRHRKRRSGPPAAP